MAARLIQTSRLLCRLKRYASILSLASPPRLLVCSFGPRGFCPFGPCLPLIVFSTSLSIVSLHGGTLIALIFTHWPIPLDSITFNLQLSCPAHHFPANRNSACCSADAFLPLVSSVSLAPPQLPDLPRHIPHQFKANNETDPPLPSDPALVLRISSSELAVN